MSLTVLSIAFSLTFVGADSVGGAEQVLSAVDEGLARRGHTSLVIAAPESKVAGTLIPTERVPERICNQTWVTSHQATRKAIAYALDRYPVDLVHLHGMDFADYLPTENVPVLVTLHLPLDWYKPASLRTPRPQTFFQCVSRSQRVAAPSGVQFLADIENGVHRDLLEDSARFHKRDFAVSLGRICPEKGFHFALRAAKQAQCSMFLAGHVYPFEEHRRYFAEYIAPELDAHRRYLGPVGLRKKRRLLSAARCTVVSSLVPETSSLVARESLACGTPVVAFARGALPELVEQ